MRTLLLFGVIGVLASSAAAHPPSGKLPPLSPATKAMVERAARTNAEADLLAAKRALAAEGRYACCINGGCTECLKEGVCACGPLLLAKEGVCADCVEGWKGGAGKFSGIDPKEMRLESMAGRRGSMGAWAMNREGSGTSWLPDASPMLARMETTGRWQVMLGGFGYGVATASRARGRGGDATYVSSHGMAMAWQTSPKGSQGVRLMASGDPWSLGRGGYPLLFQTGEGLTDRQHPHDLLTEAAATFTRNLSGGRYATLYVAPVGEPALGPAAYVMRPSAFDNPEAPLGHHAFDATHITPGVITASLASGKLKLDASLFNGREPDGRRSVLDTIALDARSVRLTANPSANLSAQISYAELHGEPRVIVSASRQSGDWSATAGWVTDHGQSWLLEAARLRPKDTLFARAESVPRDGGRVGKLTFGGVKNVARKREGEWGVGASLSVHSVSAGLRSGYGNAPVTANLFIRLRAGRM